jgi:hypothetical protein
MKSYQTVVELSILWKSLLGPFSIRRDLDSPSRCAKSRHYHILLQCFKVSCIISSQSLSMPLPAHLTLWRYLIRRWSESFLFSVNCSIIALSFHSVSSFSLLSVSVSSRSRYFRDCEVANIRWEVGGVEKESFWFLPQLEFDRFQLKNTEDVMGFFWIIQKPPKDLSCFLSSWASWVSVLFFSVSSDKFHCSWPQSRSELAHKFMNLSQQNERRLDFWMEPITVWLVERAELRESHKMTSLPDRSHSLSVLLAS